MNKKLLLGALLTSSMILTSSVECFGAAFSFSSADGAGKKDTKSTAPAPAFSSSKPLLGDLLKNGNTPSIDMGYGPINRNLNSIINEAITNGTIKPTQSISTVGAPTTTGTSSSSNSSFKPSVTNVKYQYNVEQAMQSLINKLNQEAQSKQTVSKTNYIQISVREKTLSDYLAENLTDNSDRRDNSNATEDDRTLTTNNSSSDPHEYTNQPGQITYDGDLKRSTYDGQAIVGDILTYKDEIFSEQQMKELEDIVWSGIEAGNTTAQIRADLDDKLSEYGSNFVGAMEYYQTTFFVDNNGNLSSGKKGNLPNVDLISVKVGDNDVSKLDTTVSTRQIPYNPPTVVTSTPPNPPSNPSPNPPSTPPSNPPTGGSTEGVGGRQTGGSTEGVGGR